MKKTFIRIMCMLIAIVMVMTVAACGENATNPIKLNGGKGSSQTGTNSGIKIEWNKPESMVGANGKDYSDYNPYEGIEKYKGTTVKFATWTDHSQTEGALPIKQFKEKYDINVELVYCSQDKYVEEILALIAANNAPDIFVENQTFPVTLQIAQEISAAKLDLNEPIWDKQVINACTVGNKVYAVNTMNGPWNGSGIVIFNRELMEANGIKTPEEYYNEGNWTWDTMTEVMEQVDKLGSDFYGGSIPDVNELYSSLGADIFSYDSANGKFANTLTDANVVKAFQYVANGWKSGLLTEQEKFKAGKVGLIIKSTYGLKKTGYFKDMDALDLGFTYLPDMDEKTKAKHGGSLRAYGIVKGSKNPEAAGMFIRYFLDSANYDLGDTFVSEEAGEFYFDLLEKMYTESKSENRTFNYAGVAGMTGESIWGWTYPAQICDPAQCSATLATKNNNCNTAVNKANELLAKMK